MTLESGIERQVCLSIVAAWQHAICLKLGKEGWPDRQILLGEGQSFFVEFKQKGEPLRPDQQVRMRDLVTAGNVVLAIDSRADGEQLAEVIRGAKSASRALCCVVLWALDHAPTVRALRLSGAGGKAGRRSTADDGLAGAGYWKDCGHADGTD
jgi:hypothetical protein